MNDRELLELAAKAADIPRNQWDYDGMRQVGHMVTPSMMWNPLTDDGVALRLAVICDMTICADGISTVSAQSGYGRDRIMVTQAVVECKGDKQVATRRAIVRAAAEIGKGMKP